MAWFTRMTGAHRLSDLRVRRSARQERPLDPRERGLLVGLGREDLAVLLPRVHVAREGREVEERLLVERLDHVHELALRHRDPVRRAVARLRPLHRPRDVDDEEDAVGEDLEVVVGGDAEPLALLQLIAPG